MDFNILLNTYKVMFENKYNISIDIASDLINVPENYKYMTLEKLSRCDITIHYLIECLNTQRDSSMYVGECMRDNMDIKQYKMDEYRTFFGQLGTNYKVYECDYSYNNLYEKVKGVC